MILADARPSTVDMPHWLAFTRSLAVVRTRLYQLFAFMLVIAALHLGIMLRAHYGTTFKAASFSFRRSGGSCWLDGCLLEFCWVINFN
jgi:hypothetical protein